MPITTETKNMLRARLQTLPSDVQQAIFAIDLRKKLQAITEKHRLHLDQAGELEDETLFIMLGLEHPKDYIRNVMRELSVDADTAKKIAMDVNEQIFRPIRESLKQIHNVSDENQESRIKNQENLKSEIANLKSAEDHPIVQLKKTSEEARALLNKNLESGIKNQEKSEQQSLQPTTYNLQPKDEHPILRLKKEVPKQFSGDRGKIIGWPQKEELRSKNHESREKILDEKTKNIINTARPFFKITPGDKKQELGIKNQDAIVERPTSLNWEPEMPEKEAPAPENLPVETEKDEAPPVGAYPPVPNWNQESGIMNHEITGGRPTSNNQDLAKTKTIEKPEQRAQDSVAEKLSSSFKLPRAETEYKEKQRPSSPPPHYGGGDPYREPTE